MAITFTPEIFAGINVDTNEPTAASPERPADPNWRGISIRCPQRVYFTETALDPLPGRRLTIPICGYYLVDIKPDAEPMTIIAVDLDSGKQYSGLVRERDPSPLIPPDPDLPPPSPEEFAGMASGGYFNLDLCAFAAIPMQSGRYDISVTFSSHSSNHLEMRLVKEIARK